MVQCMRCPSKDFLDGKMSLDHSKDPYTQGKMILTKQHSVGQHPGDSGWSKFAERSTRSCQPNYCGFGEYGSPKSRILTSSCHLWMSNKEVSRPASPANFWKTQHYVVFMCGWRWLIAVGCLVWFIFSQLIPWNDSQNLYSKLYNVFKTCSTTSRLSAILIWAHKNSQET